MDTLKKEVEQIVTYPINFNSPQNVAHILFDVLGLKLPTDKFSGKKGGNTRKGNRSTSESVLKKLAPQHKLPSMILGILHYCLYVLNLFMGAQSTDTAKSYFPIGWIV